MGVQLGNTLHRNERGYTNTNENLCSARHMLDPAAHNCLLTPYPSWGCECRKAKLTVCAALSQAPLVLAEIELHR
jgi:hypothetical protein